jgi:hypothetical protein
MAVRLSNLCAGRPLPPGRFLVLISVRGWVDPREIVRLEKLGQLKDPMTSSGIEPATFVLSRMNKIKTTVSWNMPCSLSDVALLSRGTCCLHLRSLLNQTTRRHVPECSNLHCYRRVNIRSHSEQHGNTLSLPGSDFLHPALLNNVFIYNNCI